MNMLYVLLLFSIVASRWIANAFTKYGCTNGAELYVDDPDYDISCQKEPYFNITFGPNVKVITRVTAIYVSGVTFSDSVTSIEDDAFNFNLLEFINFGKNVETIGSNAFYYCNLLRSLEIPDSVKVIGDHAFDSSISLRKLTLGKNIEKIGDFAFYGAAVGGNLVLPDSVRSIGISSFAYWENIESVTINEGLTYIADTAFFRCGMETLTLSNTVEYIGTSAFASMFNIQTINWGNSVSVIDDRAFELIGTVMDSLVIPDSVTFIGDFAFSDCYIECLLESVTLGANIESIGTFAFGVTDVINSYGASVLSSVIFTGNKLVSIGDAAFYNTKLSAVVLPEGLRSIGNDSFAACADLELIQLPQSLEIIGDGAFENCTALVSIGIPDSVTIVGESAFSECSALECVYWDTTIDRLIGVDAFNQCPLTGCGPSAVPTLRPTVSPTVSSKPTVSFVPSRLPTFAKTNEPTPKPTTPAPTMLGKHPKFGFTMSQKLKGIDADTFNSENDNSNVFVASVMYICHIPSLSIEITEVTNSIFTRTRRSLFGLGLGGGLGGGFNATNKDSIFIVYNVVFESDSFEDSYKLYQFIKGTIINATRDGSMTDYLRYSIETFDYDVSPEMEDAKIVDADVIQAVVYFQSDDYDDYVTFANDDSKTSKNTLTIAVAVGVGGGVLIVGLIMGMFWYSYKGVSKIVPDDASKSKYEVQLSGGVESVPIKDQVVARDNPV